MDKKDIQYFTEKLEKEKKLLEEELATVGRTNIAAPGGWEANAGKMEVDTADENEVADKMEELEENQLIMEQLEKQLQEVGAGLERIDKNTYGICEKGDRIEKERLEANPSARTCMSHMK